jgi:ankyrin repeat protein
MNITYLIIAFIFLTLSTSCIFPNSKEKEREKRLQEAMVELSIEEELSKELGSYKDFLPDSIDYEYDEIAEDSLDLKLYELVLSTKSIEKEVLLKNIEILIKKGADPNAMVETTYLVRKTGTYIPIVKRLYRNKYREHTKITSSMHAAVGTGKTWLVSKLMQLGGNINVKNPKGSYPIDMALMADNRAMIYYLIPKADLSKADLSNSRNTAVIEEMVKSGANPKTIDINYALNYPTELKRLLALKPDLDNTAFNFGKVMKDDELADLLFDNGLSPKAMGKFPDECPAIFAAIKYNNFRVFKKLHQMGANLTEVCKRGFGDTPMQRAIHYQRIDVIKYLLEHKISPNEKDWTKKSILIMACNTDNDEIVQILLDAGAELEYKGYFGKTPLFNAVEMDKYIAADCLIKNKANVNFTTKRGKRPVHAAIDKNNYPMLKLLVENGAATDILYENKNLVEFAEAKEAAPAIISYLKKQIEK